MQAVPVSSRRGTVIYDNTPTASDLSAGLV
jgi:hypothetical protein